jgi:hypothetical protein
LDLILHQNRRTRLVLELKLDKPGEAGPQKLREYLDLTSLKNSSGGELIGALVCRDFEADVIALSQKKFPLISLYSYKYKDQLELNLISGSDVLNPV